MAGRTPEAAYRTRDVVCAGAAVVVLAPLIGATAVMVRAKLGSPVIFVQERPGRAGRPFKVRKFRTMLTEDPARGLASDADRLIPFGRFLRSTSLDELPSLFNVLVGDMSLVGPRPLLMSYLDRYTPEQARRHEVRPGLTGWAQISGRNELSWDDKLALDVWYVDNRTFMLDVKILLRTISLVLRRAGISAPGHETAPEFMGSEVVSTTADGLGAAS